MTSGWEPREGWQEFTAVWVLLYRPWGQKQPVEVVAFLISVADIKSPEEEEEQFIYIYLYHITDFKVI